MSIFKSKKASGIKRSAFVLLTAMCCIFFLFPIYSYAETSSDGASDGSVTEQTVFSSKVYHKHTGSRDKSGGCYSVAKTETKTVVIPCDGKMIYWPALDNTSCNRCGASYFGDQSGRGCWKSTTENRTSTYYALGCGLGEDTLLGTLTVRKSTNEWTKSVVLTASYEVDEALIVTEQPYIWNEGAATNSNTYEADACGEYSLRLNTRGNADSARSKIVMNVRNVDVTAPVIRAHEQEPAEGWNRDGIQVSLTEASDLQPDGTEGCGLHETPYSYDNGASWTAENTCFYKENGNYNILVRDKLENCFSYAVSFHNIDSTVPTLTVDYDKTVNSKTVEVKVQAQDLQPDGTEGSGLHEMPYSFDNGQSWTEDSTFLVDKNRSLFIAVRDKVGNVAYLEERIGNIDSYGPAIHYEMVSDSWTNTDVKLYIWAEDVNGDGSQGSGLSDKWYSLDDGKTWSNMPVHTISENKVITVIARDLLDNRSKQQIVIDQIDREAPQITLSVKVSGKGDKMKVKLQADASDERSGLHERAYSWDEGESFSNESTKNVTRNGTYSVTVRDRAGNSKKESVEVDVFKTRVPATDEPQEADPDPVDQAPPETESGERLTTPPKESFPVEEEEMTEPQTAEEINMEENVVLMEERVDDPEPVKVQELKEKDIWTRGELIVLIVLLLTFLLLMLFLFQLWVRTIVMLARDNRGQMQYMGRLWIRRREEHYEVLVPQHVIEQCETTHFRFCPSALFVRLHSEEDIHFLFPDGVCVTLPIAHKMEME